MDNATLKPCPFCGVVPEDLLGDVHHMCRVLGVRIAAFRDDWNTRHPLPYVHGVKFEPCAEALPLLRAAATYGILTAAEREDAARLVARVDGCQEEENG